MARHIALAYRLLFDTLILCVVDNYLPRLARFEVVWDFCFEGLVTFFGRCDATSKSYGPRSCFGACCLLAYFLLWMKERGH